MFHTHNINLKKHTDNCQYKNAAEVETLKTELKSSNIIIRALIEKKINFIPVVYAAEPPKIPQKPPKMKYTDLPTYESPHYEYKNYLEDLNLCPLRHQKIIQSALYPSVQKARRILSESVFGMTGELKLMKNEALDMLNKQYVSFIDYMRSPANLSVRQGTVFGGTLFGAMMIGGGKMLRFFGGTAGALASGALCFPQETEKIFVQVAYTASSSVLCALSCFCNKDFRFKTSPCRHDMPSPPPPLTENQKNKCPEPGKPLKK